MTEVQLDLKSDSRRGTKWISLLLKLSACAVALVVGLVVWRVFDVRSQQSTLRARLAELAAAGRVVDAAGMKRLHEEKTSDELTEEWRALFVELADPELRMAAATLPIVGGLEGEANRVPSRGEAWESEAEARKFLSDTKAVRDRLRKLAVKGRAVYFPMQYEGEDKGGSEGHAGIEFACRMLFFEGLAALRFNAPAAAVEDVRCLLGLVQVLEGEPSMMSMAVCSSAEKGAMQLVKIAVERRSLSGQQLAQVVEALQSYQPANERFQLAVQGERGMLQTELDAFAAKQGMMYSIFGAPRFRTATLELLDRLEAAPLDDIEGLLKVGRDVQAAIEELGFGNQGSADIMAPTALIPFTARTSTMVSREMERRLAMLAVAVQMYRAKSVKLPSDIAEVGKLGLDPTKLMPVGGKPFGYRVSEDGSSGVLWGFSLLTNAKQTPDEPPETDDPSGLNAAWVWSL